MADTQSPDAGVADKPRPSRMDTLMPAAIGVAGVVIGVLVTAGIAYLGNQQSRVAAEQEAKRLIAAEVLLDTHTLIHAATWGTLSGTLPTTGEWSSQGATLARYTSSGTWMAVSTFYANLLSNEHSLTTTCIGGKNPHNDVRNEVRTTARLGNTAYEALTGSRTGIPSIAQVNLTYGCP